ncbi:hypothetical protein [Flavobacterium terrae]|uniref:Uncharacterized protein n=1 Tax=Flavobacterium terrae TaxID=415425 RepID=A0A1M6GUW3_9FLAO|nr:hypothetical protein [Flavobacterium terrae]SHJ13694.1 hypothetical protein SAMN05444363_2740 [Flavobacterium terrae]
MNPTIKNILIVISGIFVGSIVNMAIILMGTSIIKLPEGIDPANVDSLKQGMHLLETKHFIAPFLAHALGSFTGAFVVSKFAVSKKMFLAMLIGFFFLLGGISNVFSFPAPTWFCILDLALAYLPMAYLGFKLAMQFKK